MSNTVSGFILTQNYLDELTYKILGCAIEVHKRLGPGLLESVYEKCFLAELEFNGLEYTNQSSVPVVYRGIKVQADLRFDVLVEDLILVDLKTVDVILPINSAQILTYMRLLQKPKGVIINFNCLNIIKEGKRTLVNELYAELPKI